MHTKGYQNYIEAEVQSASPVKLVSMLYRAGLDAVASARNHLRAGDIRARSRAINTAMAIVTQLSLSLDRTKGGEVSDSLADLYEYMETQLIKGNFEQSDPPLAQVERLLSTLLSAWETVASRASSHLSGEALPQSIDYYRPLSYAF